jgi:hypothetical protein
MMFWINRQSPSNEDFFFLCVLWINQTTSLKRSGNHFQWWLRPPLSIRTTRLRRSVEHILWLAKNNWSHVHVHIRLFKQSPSTWVNLSPCPLKNDYKKALNGFDTFTYKKSSQEKERSSFILQLCVAKHISWACGSVTMTIPAAWSSKLEAWSLSKAWSRLTVTIIFKCYIYAEK